MVGCQVSRENTETASVSHDAQTPSPGQWFFVQQTCGRHEVIDVGALDDSRLIEERCYSGWKSRCRGRVGGAGTLASDGAATDYRQQRLGEGESLRKPSKFQRVAEGF